MSNFVATDVYALFNIYVEKFATWVCKSEGGGGGQGPFTQCVKKHLIWYKTASLRFLVISWVPERIPKWKCHYHIIIIFVIIECCGHHYYHDHHLHHLCHHWECWSFMGRVHPFQLITAPASHCHHHHHHCHHQHHHDDRHLLQEEEGAGGGELTF